MKLTKNEIFGTIIYFMTIALFICALVYAIIKLY